MGIFDALSEFDAVMAGDDLASCGRRLYPAGTSRDPFERMAERILHAPPDPTRGNSFDERRKHLLEMAEHTGASGIIFYIVKFCEPELFDLPILQKELREAGLPTLLIEVDLNSPFSQQAQTRLGAFLEMIQ
jgi:benzoyl-CoA reductase/2-hydroxyglutaryl-CoA dehydratase subunit BcrC/BadD/HgdB